jgi:dipeptidyl aminopeptidase/acylaminoacyl peptidase
MLSSLTETKEIQLTRGVYSSVQPRWSPDGKHIAFLSSRPVPKEKKSVKGARKDEGDDEDKDDAPTQVWLIHAFGGEPWVLTESPRDVRACGWLDADTVVYVAQEKKTLREKTLKTKKDSSDVVEDEPNEPPVRLWQIDLAAKKAERLTDNKDRISSLSVSPDRRYALTVHERSLSYTYDNKIKPIVVLHDFEKKTHKTLFEDTKERRFNITRLAWQPDSKGFYAIDQFTHHPHYVMAYVLDVFHYDLAGAKTTRVDLSWDKGLADADDCLAPIPGGFVALLADGAVHKLARYDRDGERWRKTDLDKKNLDSLLASRDGKTLIYHHSTSNEPPRWLRSRLKRGKLGEGTVLTDLQAELRERKRARTEIIRWKGARGEEVEGLLHYPHDYDAGRKYPLVVAIHGGPFGADFDAWNESWAYVQNLLNARGAFVLRPNYHGSSNYGLAFAESIANGNYYKLPVEDIEKGIDFLVGKNLVERDKVGLTGWSNGAILTMALITRRHYQAASAGAGGSEWVGDWGVCEFGMSFSNYYLGKSPLEDPDVYRKNAPLYDFGKVQTPVLLFHGSEDRAVPTHHGWLQFRVLQQLGKPVRFVLFPGEKHSLKKLAHQRRKVEEELAWFDRYLFKTLKPDNPSLKEDSPLAQALALHKSARQGRLYGSSVKGVLTPETVAYKDLEIGRFEVTRAQFAQFDKEYAVEPGTENYPASGITFARAKAYCAWLSQATGKKYRLGSKEEMEDLYKDADSSDNTLDTWAGYTVNPEDKERLRDKIKELPGPAPLLKPVGSFAPTKGKAAVFDLGGNVAEWVQEGEALGGSADRSVDEQQRSPPAPAYIGLRVVREK